VEVPARPAVLIVDDNRDLLLFLTAELREGGWQMLMAENAAHAREVFLRCQPGAVLLDYLLGEDDGLKLGLEFQAHNPNTQIIMMTGGGLTEEELFICNEHNFPILFKPFLACDVLNLIRRYPRTRAAVN
jgi:DNA-binding NtrC family response regulator